MGAPCLWIAVDDGDTLHLRVDQYGVSGDRYSLGGTQPDKRLWGGVRTIPAARAVENDSVLVLIRFRLRVADCRLRSGDCGVWIADLWTAESGLQIGDRRLRLPIPEQDARTDPIHNLQSSISQSTIHNRHSPLCTLQSTICN